MLSQSLEDFKPLINILTSIECFSGLHLKKKKKGKISYIIPVANKVKFAIVAEPR